jgi:hypothetical protein
VAKSSFKFLLAILAASVLAHAQDSEPDLKKEEYFHNIYKKFNEQPTSAEAWEKVLSNRKPNTYSIQEKDTLWDISQTFFGDAHYWPKVWSYNTDDILNPHEISPKQSIRFYAGTITEAPTVGLATKETPEEELPQKVIEKNEEGKVEAISLPPPLHKSRPVVKKLPKSLPLYRIGGVNNPPVEFQNVQPKHIPVATKFISHYVTEHPPTSMGQIVEAELNEGTTATEFQNVIVRVSNPGAKKFLVYKDNTSISDPMVTLGASVPIVEVQGTLEILDKVNDSDNLYRAVVTKVIAPVEVGAQLTTGSLETFKVESSAPVTSVQARIIGGQYERLVMKMFGDDNLIFLNAGAKQGLQLGSTLQVFLNERLRNSRSKSVINDRKIGFVKIVNVSDNFATAYVLHTDVDLMVGDYVGSASAVGSSASAGDEMQLDGDAMPTAPPPPPSDNSMGGEKPTGDDDLKLE